MLARVSCPRIFVAGALACLIAACGGAACPRGSLPEPRQLWEAAAQREQITSLRAEASVVQRGPEGRIRGRVMMFMERPDRVRFDAMTQFGPVAILTSDGERFALTELEEKRFYEGVSCPRNIGRMLGVELAAAEVLGLLLAELPQADVAAEEQTRCEEGTLRVRRGASAGGWLEARFEMLEGGGLRLVAVAREDRNGEPIWSVAYDRYHEVSDGVLLPGEVRLVDQRNDSELLVRFKQVDVNVQVPPGAFTQRPRPGLSVEEVPCQ